MILDTSAIIAVVQREISAPAIERVIAASASPAISAATVVELSAVLRGRDRPAMIGFIDRLLRDWGVEIVAFDAEQARIAQRAYRDYGRGSTHPARLNLAECYSYALAVSRDEPLLFVGDDFRRTDVRIALA